MGAGNFSLADVTVSYAGLSIGGGGYGTDGGVKIEPLAERYGTRVGLTGNVIRWKIGNNVLKIDISTAYGSDESKILAAIFEADDLLNGIGMQPLIIVDTRNTLTMVAGTAWISAIPTVDLKNEPSDLVYGLQCAFDVYVPS